MPALLNTLETVFNTAKTSSHTAITLGFGLYATAVDAAKTASDKISATFNTLVEKGNEVEPKVKEQISQLTGKPITFTDTFGDIEAKAQSITARITGIDNGQLERMEAKLDAMTETLQKMKAAS